MANPKRKPRKRRSGSGAGKKFPPSGAHRTVSTQPGHCFFTWSFSDGEKWLNYIQMSSSRCSSNFLPPTPKAPLENVSGKRGGTLAGAADVTKPIHNLRPITRRLDPGDRNNNYISTESLASSSSSDIIAAMVLPQEASPEEPFEAHEMVDLPASIQDPGTLTDQAMKMAIISALLFCLSWMPLQICNLLQAISPDINKFLTILLLHEMAPIPFHYHYYLDIQHLPDLTLDPVLSPSPNRR